MVRGQLLRAVETKGDGTVCAISEVLDMSVRPPSVESDHVPRLVELDLVVEIKHMVGALENVNHGDVLILTTIGSLLNDPKEDDNAMDVDDEDDENDKQDDEEQDDESDPLSKIVSQHQIGTTRICIVEDVMDDEGTSLFNHRKNQQVKQSGRRTLRLRFPPSQYQDDVANNNVRNYSFRHIVHGKEEVKSTYHLMQHLARANKAASSVVGTAGGSAGGRKGPPSVPGWLRETLVQGKILGETTATATGKYDLGDLFWTKEVAENYIQQHKVPPLSYEDEDERDDPPPNAQFNTRLLLPSGSLQVYYNEARKTQRNTTSNHHNRSNKTYTSTKLNATQIECVIDALQSKERVTLLRGGPGTGKTECVIKMIEALSRSKNERILVLTPNVGAVDRILSKLNKSGSVVPRKIVRIGGSGHGYGNFGPGGRRDLCLRRQRDILNEVSKLGTSLGVTSKGTTFTCETAGHFYNVHIRPRIELFESTLEGEGGGAHDPFAIHFGNSSSSSSSSSNGNGNGLAALDRMEKMTDMFLELKDYAPFEWMPFARLQSQYVVTSMSTVVGASVNGFIREIERYEKNNSGPSFTTIIIDGASSMTDAALTSVLAYNRKRTARLVLTGDVKSTTVVPSSFARLTSGALYSGAKLNLSMFERLSSSASAKSSTSSATTTTSTSSTSTTTSSDIDVGIHDLSVHQRSRDSVSSLYRWRYGSSMSLSKTSFASKRHSNAGLQYTTQFIDVSEGEELACPQGGYQNLAEAEYIVSVYQYLRLLGHQGHQIAILATYDEQSALIRDVMNLRCVDSPHFGKPNDVTTIEKYAGRECDIVLLSTVRTTQVPEVLESMPDLVGALSRARLGLYVFGSRHPCEESYTLTPFMSNYTNIPKQLCLVGGEQHPSARKINDTSTPGTSMCQVTGVLHMASIVRMMVGAPLLPGSVIKR